MLPTEQNTSPPQVQQHQSLSLSLSKKFLPSFSTEVSLLSLDVLCVDLYQREIKNELTLRRNQVCQLKKDLDNANLKIFELTKHLENSKSALKETEFNLKLALKKSSSLEENMKQMEESFMKMKLKEEMRVTEMNILNENVQKMAHVKNQLTREVNELNDKLKFYYAFQNELENRQSKINETLMNIKDNSEKLENEHSKLLQFNRDLKCADEFRNMCTCLAEENKKLKKENVDLENSVIENSALCEKLTNLINSHKHVNMHEQNLITKIKYLQWETRYKDLQQQTTSNENLIQALTDALNKEIATNAKMILKTEECETRMAELEKKLASKTDLLLKSEPVEVVEIE